MPNRIGRFVAPLGNRLIASGNEITDIQRTQALSWTTATSGGGTDGAAIPGGWFIGRAATNLHPRAQVDSAPSQNYTFSSSGDTGVTAAIDATVAAPFGPQCFRVNAQGVATQGIVSRTNTGQNIAAGTPVVGSVYFRGTAGNSYRVFIRVQNTDSTTDSGPTTTFTATGNWQLLTPASYAVQPGKTGDTLRVDVTQTVATAEALRIAHPMIEKGQTAVAPYVPTSGGSTATRAAGRVQIPASLLSGAQGCLAMRFRIGWNTTDTAKLAWNPCIFSLSDSANDRLEAWFYNNGGVPKVRLVRVAGGIANGIESTCSLNAGDVITVILAWTPTQIKLSINGSAFITGGSTAIPTIINSLIDIGRISWVSTSQLDASVLWLALLSGTLNDTEAAAIHNRLNAGGMPTLTDLPGNPTMVWDGNTDTYYTLTTPLRARSNRTSKNRIPNGNFEVDTSNWNINAGTGGSFVSSNTFARLGSRSGKLTVGADGDRYISPGGDVNALRLGMVGGQTYTWSAWVYIPSGNGSTWSLKIFDNDGSGYQATTSPFINTFDQWVRVIVTRTLRANATEAFVRLENNTALAGQVVYIDGAQLEPGSQATEFNDGATTWHSARIAAPPQRNNLLQTFESGDYKPGWADHAYIGTGTNPPTGTRSIETTIVPPGLTKSIKIVKNVSETNNQEFGLVRGPNLAAGDWVHGALYRWGCWVWCDTPNVAQLQGNVSGVYTSLTNGATVNQWRWVETTFIADTTTQRTVRLFIAGTTAAVTAYFSDPIITPVYGPRMARASRANKVHTVQFPGLVTNLVGRTDNLGHTDWGSYYSKPTFTAGQTDPFGGTGAIKVSAQVGGNGGNYVGFLQICNFGVNALASGWYTSSVWLKTGSGTESVNFGLKDGRAAIVTATTTWQRFSVTNFYPGGENNERFFQLYVTNSQTMPDLYIYAPQTEPGLVMNQYVPNPGPRGSIAQQIPLMRATATRATTTHIGRIGTATPLQGLKTPNYTLLDWSDGPGKRIVLRYRLDKKVWEFIRDSESGGEVGVTSGTVLSSGTSLNVVARWEQSKIGLSVNNSAFVDVPTSTFPTIKSLMVYIGRQAENIGLNVRWQAGGVNTISGPNLTTLNSFPTSTPTIDQLPDGTTVLREGESQTGVYRADEFIRYS